MDEELARLLRLDRLKLRRLVPRRGRQRPYDWMLIRNHCVEQAFELVAVWRDPRR